MRTRRVPGPGEDRAGGAGPPAQTWLGLSYIGLLDDLAIFDRALSGEEIRTLYRLDGGVGSLRRSSI